MIVTMATTLFSETMLAVSWTTAAVVIAALIFVTTCIIGSYLVHQSTSRGRKGQIWLPKPLHRLRCRIFPSDSINGRNKAERERRAKQSFSVRRNDLAKIARGEPTGRQKRSKDNKKKNMSSARRNERPPGVQETYASKVSRNESARDCWTGRFSSLVWSSGGDRSKKIDNSRPSRPTLVAHHSEDKEEGGLENVAVMGLDCEMVGAGRDGNISLLGRCSLVLLVRTEEQHDDEKSKVDSFEVRTIYDKFVRPSRTVTDYRTQWSGITKDDLKGLGFLPCVPFQVCRSEVSALLASFEGKPVVLVGHALKNDFNVLRLRHPFGLTRDTATYRPFMRHGRSKHKILQRKLSQLVEEELGMEIQNDGGGHSSVEDAEAALKLYWKVRNEWEHSLGYPLRSFGAANNGIGKESSTTLKENRWPPVTLYLDGCNLPLGIRSNKLNGQSKGKGDDDVSWQLISKTSTQGTAEVYVSVDWMPILRSALASSTPSIFNKIFIMFDGAKFSGTKKDVKAAQTIEIFPNIFFETTDVGVEVDDVLVERCGGAGKHDSNFGCHEAISGPIVSSDDVVDALSSLSDMGYGALDQHDNDKLDCYAVVRRKGGGTKTNKKLFHKLNLRRPEEGAFCLTGLTARLQKNSLQIARDLQRARVYDIVEYELRSRANLRNIIITDDILLTDRLVNHCGGENLVLSWRQLQQMF